MPFQLHVSGLNLASRCGEWFRRRYVEGEKTPASVSMAAGTAVDAAVNFNLTTKIETGVLAAADAVQDCARDVAAQEWDRGVVLDQEDAADGLHASKAELVDRAVALVWLHHQKIAPLLRPTAVQRKWVIEPSGLPGTALQLAGTIDIQEGADAIRDTKTSAKSPPSNLADVSLQLTMYAFAVAVFDGAIPGTVGLDYVVQTKAKHLTHQRLESHRTPADFDHLSARVDQISLMLKTGTFTPAPLDSWWCSAVYCPFHPTCRFARQPVSVAV